MDKIIAALCSSARVIGIVRTKGGGDEAATVRRVSEALERERYPYLIIHKQSLDRSYGPGSEERAKKNPEVWSTATIVHQKIIHFEEARAYPSTQLQDVWTNYSASDIAACRDLLSKHKIILTLGNDSGAVDYEYHASVRLCDLVILTMDRAERDSWRGIGIWTEVATKEERQKLWIACWDTSRPNWAVDLFSADEFEARQKEQEANDLQF